MSKITFSQAMQGYLLAIGARHLSEHTVKDYVNTFHKFTTFLGEDIPIEDITHKQIEAFFTAQTTVSNKTLLNYHTGLSSPWTWAMPEHLVQHTATVTRNPCFGCKQNICHPISSDNAATLILIARRVGESNLRRTSGADTDGGRIPV